MKDLKQFVEDSIKTESVIERVVVNEDLLKETIAIMIAAGNILDQMKKHVFYGENYNRREMHSHVATIASASTTLEYINGLTSLEDNETVLSVNPRVFHSIVGIATESTELLEALSLDGDMDDVNIGEEFGDIDWYKAIGCDELGIEWDLILDTVINKLKIRYPDKFTSDDAINRDLNKERSVLNKMANENEETPKS